MRTLMTIFIGLILFMVIYWVVKLIKKKNDLGLAFWIFLPLWFCLVSWNMYHGISLGYGFVEEIPFFLLNFCIPIAVAYFIMRTRASSTNI